MNTPFWRVFVVVVTAIVLLFGWPTPFRYDRYMEVTVRTNRITGSTSVVSPKHSMPVSRLDELLAKDATR